MRAVNPYPDTNKADKCCLSTAYLAPIEYYRVLANVDEVLLEQHEFYVKQSYRNRCVIATANGLMDLTIPVEKFENGKTRIRDVRISYHGNWQLQHWRSIASAYNSSPFFEYYMDDLIVFYEKRWNFLWDFNVEIQQKILELIDLQPVIRLTEIYSKDLSDRIKDLRSVIHPKKKLVSEHTQPYYQVFVHKYGFQPNLSVLDLLLNMGNEAIFTLKK
ncbi:MAG: WbqC family protein [Paludibacter sp.]|nr:WbqC family protein [Paludibacter sp.]